MIVHFNRSVDSFALLNGYKRTPDCPECAQWGGFRRPYLRHFTQYTWTFIIWFISDTRTKILVLNLECYFCSSVCVCVCLPFHLLPRDLRLLWTFFIERLWERYLKNDNLRIIIWWLFLWSWRDLFNPMKFKLIQITVLFL